MVLYKEYIVEYKDFPIKGINYLDLNPIYADHSIRRLLVNDCRDAIISEFRNTHTGKDFDYIGVVESRGFLVGSILAHELQKGIVLLRSKKNRLPGKTHTVKYQLEYGESVVQVQEGSGKVLIFDDVLATGGTTNGSIECLTKAGYTPVGALFLVELDFLNPLLSVPYKSIIHYE
jgi:adenine phosphoribosyltransferase